MLNYKILMKVFTLIQQPFSVLHLQLKFFEINEERKLDKIIFQKDSECEIVCSN